MATFRYGLTTATSACSLTGRTNQSLQCYDCISNINDREPQCDNNLWKHLRHSEKFKLRNRCNSEVPYCYKRIRKRFGERMTQRGCFDEISSHGKKAATGCVSFQEDQYLTTLCFCNENLCNRAAQFDYAGTDTVLLGAIFTVVIFSAVVFACLVY